MPHDGCPMAAAIRNKRSIRGLTAQAERPDGTRATFMPFPTPFFTASDGLAGAVNMLIDITEPQQADDLRAQAARCARLANEVGDRQASDALALISVQYTNQGTRHRFKKNNLLTQNGVTSGSIEHLFQAGAKADATDDARALRVRCRL